MRIKIIPGMLARRPLSARGLLLAFAMAWAGATAAADAPRAPPIRHVFVLLLENQNFETTFGPHSPAPYLARHLPARGALLRQYYAIGHDSLPNYLALISGQAPNDTSQLDCELLEEFVPTAPGLDEHGQLHGRGCVYPAAVHTLADQLEAAGLTWKAYMQDMGNDPAREAATCGHAPAGGEDPTQFATARDQYAARHDPFVYFHSLIDDPGRCAAHVVNLRQLPVDLQRRSTTPHFVFITPNLCNDGHDAVCADGRRGGLTAVNRFLRHWVPLIEASAAFRKDGLLIITFDEGDGEGPRTSQACCGEIPLPGQRNQPGLGGPGGGRVGAVLLSPLFRPGTVSDAPYNHYSLLRSIETIFSLPGLGHAGAPDLATFGADVFTAAWPAAAGKH